jgi:hypothetical protein
VKKNLSSLVVGTLLLLPPLAVHAQEESAPPAAPAESPPTTASALEPLRREMEAMQARHDERMKALRAELAQRDAERAIAVEMEATERERLLRIYGFADMGIKRNSTPEDALMASRFTAPLTFFLGRLNLYYDSHPSPNFRFLAETRLSLYPNGVASGAGATGQVTRTSTAVSDISSPNPATTVNWGSIILERAVLDWTRYPLFSVRVGLFLTPFGIYNVDHGTPTLIATSLPIYISQGFIPERQLGIQIFGSHPVERWELGYAATVSNARSDGILDVSDSKAFGGRLFAKRQGKLRLMLGASALYQPYRRNREQFGMDANGNLAYVTTREVESQMLTLGGDLSLDYSGLRVRSELVYSQTEYTPGMREAPPEGRGGLNPDYRALNWSVILAYRWWKLEPYLHGEIFDCSPALYLGNGAWISGPGFNLYLRANVILKGSWTYVRFFQDDDPQNRASRQNFHIGTVLLTWAF